MIEMTGSCAAPRCPSPPAYHADLWPAPSIILMFMPEDEQHTQAGGAAEYLIHWLQA